MNAMEGPVKGAGSGETPGGITSQSTARTTGTNRCFSQRL